MSKSELPTLEDVALAAGVSTATVSRCLNDPDRVAAETRERVLAVVKDLRYSPNFGARALAARRTNTFGAVIPTMENAIFARGLEAFQQVLVKNGGTMLVASSSYDDSTEADQIRNMIARGADGLLLIGVERDRGLYDLLRERGVPVVVAWTQTDDPSIACVGFDNAAASYELALKGTSLGHKHIAYLSAFTDANDRARARVEGAQRALASAGMNAQAMPVIRTKYSLAHGRQAFRDLMSAATRPTLVMCANDVLAVGAIQMAHEMGLRVPEDVSITGYDDIELATIVSPGLTTIHVPHRKMGRLAAEILLDQVANDTAPQQVQLPTEIVDRGSLGPAPG